VFDEFEEFDLATTRTTIHGRTGGQGPPLLLRPRSRRPHTSPNATSGEVIGKIVHLPKTYHFWALVHRRAWIAWSIRPGIPCPSWTSRAPPELTSASGPSRFEPPDVQR
jgi:hypothetical protein